MNFDIIIRSNVIEIKMFIVRFLSCFVFLIFSPSGLLETRQQFWGSSGIIIYSNRGKDWWTLDSSITDSVWNVREGASLHLITSSMVETMTERFTLVTALRDKIYSVNITVLQKLSKLCKETVKPEESARIIALKVIEDFIENTVKEEDDGVKVLTDLCEAFEKINILLSTSTPTHSWKKELKISEQIGDPKTQFSFVSLVRQIETTVIKKYTETEIVEAVLKAIQPGSNLRSYLECRTDVDRPQMKQIIRAHSNEKNATELYQELSNVAQSARENPTEFLMRAFDLRQRVSFTSGNEKGLHM